MKDRCGTLGHWWMLTLSGDQYCRQCGERQSAVTGIKATPPPPEPIRPKEGTQEFTVWSMLRDAGSGGVCGTEFLQARIARYGARIYLLRRDGWIIKKSKCPDPTHKSTQWRFTIT